MLNNNNNNRLLMVMPYPRFVRKAKEEGFWVCSIWDPRLATPAQPVSQVEELSDAYLVTDFNDLPGLQRVVREAAEHHQVDYIYHIGREESMLATYEVAECLGKSLNPARSIRLLNDKLAMRQMLQQKGVSVVRFAKAPRVADVPAALQEIGLPAVVKPTSLSGSRGVQLVRSWDDLQTWEGLIAEYSYDGPFLVEEYLTGPEFSVETLSLDGRHHVIGVTRKELSPPPLFVETGHIHPAPLPDSERSAIEHLVVTLLECCDYQFGPAHTEVIWTEAGPRIVESQARLGGDYIPQLVELATGFDMDRAIFRMLNTIPPCLEAAGRVARIAYLQFEPGVVESVVGIEEARALPGVKDLRVPFSAGDVLEPVKDSRSRHAHVIVVGESLEQTEERVRAVRALVQVRTSPCPE